MLTLTVPAKVNLTLEVMSRRPDGFHEIRSVIQTIDLCDRLHFSPDAELGISSGMPGWHAEESLVSRAARLLWEISGYQKGARIEVEKSIPLLSGLGGDSADAAATLYGLSRLWGLGLRREELLGMAARLGSDVPLFLYGGTVLVSGRGEVIKTLPPLPHIWLVIMIPPLPRGQGKTGRLYASLTPSHYTDGEATERLVLLLNRREDKVSEMLDCVSNVFDRVAFGCFEGLERYWEQFVEAGAGGVHLAGSGPALLSLFEDKTGAEEIYLNLKGKGLEVYLVDTLDRAMDYH